MDSPDGAVGEAEGVACTTDQGPSFRFQPRPTKPFPLSRVAGLVADLFGNDKILTCTPAGRRKPLYGPNA